MKLLCILIDDLIVKPGTYIWPELDIVVEQRLGEAGRARGGGGG